MHVNHGAASYFMVNPFDYFHVDSESILKSNNAETNWTLIGICVSVGVLFGVICVVITILIIMVIIRGGTSVTNLKLHLNFAIEFAVHVYVSTQALDIGSCRMRKVSQLVQWSIRKRI